MIKKDKKAGAHKNSLVNENELFVKIKTVQSLPDEVVSEFLKYKGALSSADSNIKLLTHEK